VTGLGVANRLLSSSASLCLAAPSASLRSAAPSEREPLAFLKSSTYHPDFRADLFQRRLFMSLPYKRKMIPRAKELRKEATAQENRLWYAFLSNYSVRFQRQKVIGAFIADFYCHRARLVIELDGHQHESGQGIAYDRERDAYLQGLGLYVLRFSNDAIDRSFQQVCKEIDNMVTKRLV
jgi:very-short-patch-repair endonuclease